MKYHMIGINGAGMSALANILMEQGHQVTGSDLATHRKDNIQEGMVVIRSKAVKDDNIEMQETFRLGLEHYTYPEFLGKLTKGHHTIAVCGCHGKTSTTALLAHIFEQTIGCSYLIGDGTGHAVKNSPYFILEACEYRRSFLNYYPKTTILTNIEYDHMDYYKTFEDMILAYQEFINQTETTIVAYGEDEVIRQLSFQGKNVFFYGIDEKDDFRAFNIQYLTDKTIFDVSFQKQFLGTFEFPIVGKHMMLNAISCIAVSYQNGISLEEIKESLLSFQGAHKRFEESFLKNGIVSVLDYAHHPTEVSVTIDAARQKYPTKTIVAILLPNTYSRTLTLKDDFIKALSKADVSYVTDIYCDRERQEDYPNITSSLILDSLPNGHKIDMDTVDQLLQYQDAVLLFMSCKHIDQLKKNYEEKLYENQV